MIFSQEKLLKLITKAAIEEVLAAFGNLEVFDFQPLTGWQNLGLKLTTNSGTFVLRIYRTRNWEKINLSLDVIEYLSKFHFPVQKILKTKNGERIIQFKTDKVFHLAVVFGYLEGEAKVILSKDEIVKVGSLIGELHERLRKFETSENFRKLNLNKVIKKVEKNFAKKLENEPKILKIWQKFWPEIKEKLVKNRKIMAKRQLIHGDLAPSNILFGNSEISGILDFDELIYAPKVWDITRFIGNYTLTVKGWGEEDSISQIFKNLILGYEKTSTLTIFEKQLLPELARLWFFDKIIWAKRQLLVKDRQKWARDVISWSLSVFKEEF